LRPARAGCLMAGTGLYPVSRNGILMIRS
jgi:hypothetical protein